MPARIERDVIDASCPFRLYTQCAAVTTCSASMIVPLHCSDPVDVDWRTNTAQGAAWTWIDVPPTTRPLGRASGAARSVVASANRTMLRPRLIGRSQGSRGSARLGELALAGIGAAQLRAALRAEHDAGTSVHDELAADEALERGAAEERRELLLERPRERGRLAHSSRKTPTTRPRIWTWFA